MTEKCEECERLRSKVADLRDIAVDAGVERDQALATLKAVREVVLDHDYPAGAIYDLRRILDAADGGDRDE